MKNIMYIDSSYIFLNNKKIKIAEKINYDETDKKSSLKYLFKKFKDNKYLNKETSLVRINDYEADISEYIRSLNKIDLLALNLKDANIMKIITDEALYKYDGISSSYERTNFDINLYNLDKEQLENYLLNQAKNTDGKVLVLLKTKKLEEVDNLLYLRDLFDIISPKHKKSFNKSLLINIVLDIIILALILLLIMRFIRWEST